jgi:hypothetical protein
VIKIITAITCFFHVALFGYVDTKCPVPKWFRNTFVPDCKQMTVGLNDESLKSAALVFVERHYRFAAPFEAFVYTTPRIERKGVSVGKFKITVEVEPEEVEE